MRKENISMMTLVRCIHTEMSDKEQQVIDQIDSISKRGNSAEVKKDKDGNYIVYEVKKKKTKVG